MTTPHDAAEPVVKMHASPTGAGPSVGAAPAQPLGPLHPPRPGDVKTVAKRVRHLYRFHFSDMRRERMFLASGSFFLTFGAVRTVTHTIRSGKGPFHNVSAGGLHIHHLVFGITLLLTTGYLNLKDGVAPDGVLTSRQELEAVLYGAGSALTLDEFALWLNLADVYWSEQGRESIDAVVLFGAALSLGVWGGPFFRAVAQEMVRVSHRVEGEPVLAPSS